MMSGERSSGRQTSKFHSQQLILMLMVTAIYMATASTQDRQNSDNPCRLRKGAFIFNTEDIRLYSLPELHLNICVGSCHSSNLGNKEPLYSKIMADAYSKGINGSHQMCCVPTKLRAINVLHVINQSVYDKYLNDFQAIRCGCR
ncbi:Uncharacterised protein g2694 [Pycnogonum litorale]